MKTAIGIGHNKGPSMEPGQSWRRTCWKKSRDALIGQRMPIEIVRVRVRRATELGLTYPQYASVLLASGRDIVAFLYTCDAMGLRLRRRLEMPDKVKGKLGALIDCKRTAFAPSGEDPILFRTELRQVTGLVFAGAARPPTDVDSWSRARGAIHDMLRQTRLPKNGVVLVGTRETEANWADAAALAKFLPAGEVLSRP